MRDTAKVTAALLENCREHAEAEAQFRILGDAQAWDPARAKDPEGAGAERSGALIRGALAHLEVAWARRPGNVEDGSAEIRVGRAAVLLKGALAYLEGE